MIIPIATPAPSLLTELLQFLEPTFPDSLDPDMHSEQSVGVRHLAQFSGHLKQLPLELKLYPGVH